MYVYCCVLFHEVTKRIKTMIKILTTVLVKTEKDSHVN